MTRTTHSYFHLKCGTNDIMITGKASDIQLTMDLTNICWMNTTYDDLMRPSKPHWKFLKNSWEKSCFLCDFTRWWHTDHQELYKESSKEWEWPLYVIISNLKMYIFPNTAVVRYSSYFDSIKNLNRIFVCFTWDCIFLLLMYSEQLKTQFKKSKNISKELDLNSERYQLKYWECYWCWASNKHCVFYLPH